MSKARKLSEGFQDISTKRIKHKISLSKMTPINNIKVIKPSNSPYYFVSKLKRTPSQLSINSANVKLKKSDSNNSMRRKISKNSFGQDELSFLNNKSLTPADPLKIEIKKLKTKLCSIDTSDQLPEKHKKHNEVLEKIIEKDALYGPLLSRIKHFYDELHKHYTDEIARLIAVVDSQVSEKQSYLRMVERVSKENSDLGKEVQRLEALCIDMQSMLNEIKNIDINNMQNPDNWKSLVYENNHYSVLCKNLKLDLKDYQYKEEKLIKLIEAIKNRGYPVDEIYEEDVRTKDDTESEFSKSLNLSSYKKIPSLELSNLVRSSEESDF